MEIRPLTESNAEAFWKLRLEGLRESPEAFGSSYEESVNRPMEEVAERMRASTVAGDNFLLGAFDAGQLVGLTGFRRDDGIKSSHKGMIWGVYVAPEARGNGLGRTLMREAVRRCREIPDLDQVYLGVATANEPAIRAYRSVGFETYGTEPRALKIGDSYIDEYLMVLKLR